MDCRYGFFSTKPIFDTFIKAVEQRIYGYSNFPDSYYDAVISWMKKRHKWHIEKERFVFTLGVVPAIKKLILTFTSPGDQVIVQIPGYPPFFSAIESNGRQVLENPLRLDGNKYLMDLNDLKQKINPSAKMIILCSPHIPVGRVWTREEFIKAPFPSNNSTTGQKAAGPVPPPYTIPCGQPGYRNFIQRCANMLANTGDVRYHDQ